MSRRIRRIFLISPIGYFYNKFYFLTVARGCKSDHHILIGTPGTMCDWCLKHKVVDLRKMTVFVLDEADVMIATQGHQDQSIRIQK